MRRPTILLMNRVYPPVRGATGRLLKDLAQAFVRKGWHVTIISSGPVAGKVMEKGIHIIRVKGQKKPSGALGYVWVLLKMFIVAMRLKGCHLVVSMSDPPLMVFAGAILAKIKGSRHINWCQDLYPEVMPILGYKVPGFLMKIFVKIRRWGMDNSDKVIVNGRCMAKLLINDGLDARKVAVVPNWPDLELADPEVIEAMGPESEMPKEVEGLRPFDKQLKIKQRFRILYAGTIGLVHPINAVLDAAQQLEKDGSDVEFVFVGDGKRFDYIAKERSNRGLDNIRLIPFQPISQLREVMESGDVHLITMKDDAAGYVVPSKLYSALAVARPCIFVGPEQCEISKVIRDFGTGVVVPNGDVDQIVKAVKVFRESGETWFGAHCGAVKAREIYTPANSLNGFMDKAWDLVKDKL